MKVDRDVEVFSAQAPCEPQIAGNTRDPARAFGDDDVVQCGVVANHRLCRRFDEIRQTCSWEMTSQRAHCGRRKNHIANQAQAD
jgi:hypothetical protein